MPMIRTILFGVMAALSTVSTAFAQIEPIRLTGISVFNADAPSANNWRTSPTNTSQFKLFLANSNVDLSQGLPGVLNGSSAGLNLALNSGNITFKIVGNEPQTQVTNFGVNLFFNNLTTPSISALYTAGNLVPYAASVLSPNYTSGQAVGTATSSLEFTDSNGNFVSLVGFNFAETDNNYVNGNNLALPLEPTRNSDYVGSFTLNTVPAPEPSSALLLLLASSGCVAYRRHKNNKKLSPELANA